MVNREVIVSGGAIQTPKLLQLSGIGQKSVLAKLGIKTVLDLPGVGANLHDHAAAPSIGVGKSEISLSSSLNVNVYMCVCICTDKPPPQLKSSPASPLSST